MAAPRPDLPEELELLRYDAFLSHKVSDKEPSDRIERALADAGIACWRCEHDIPGGVDDWATIERAIDALPVFVVVLTHASLQSDGVQGEMKYAREARKPTLIVELESGLRLPPGLPIRTVGCERVSVDPGNPEDGLKRVGIEALRLLGGQSVLAARAAARSVLRDRSYAGSTDMSGYMLGIPTWRDSIRVADIEDGTLLLRADQTTSTYVDPKRVPLLADFVVAADMQIRGRTV